MAGSWFRSVPSEMRSLPSGCGLFSRYPEVVKLTSTTSAAIITALKAILSRHGIPEVIRSDNGPQYASQEFSAFSDSYGFCLITSSPNRRQYKKLVGYAAV